MSYADEIVGNVLGKGPRQPRQPRVHGLKDVTRAQYRRSGKYLNKNSDYDGDGVRNWDDCYPFDSKRHMVHYGYFLVTLESGEKFIEYGSSRKQVAAALTALGKGYTEIVEVPREQALQYGDTALKHARKAWRSSKKLIR
jgi:hypothetical protein